MGRSYVVWFDHCLSSDRILNFNFNFNQIDAAGAVSTVGPAIPGHWKWHGGVLAANGNLYACPCNADG